MSTDFPRSSTLDGKKSEGRTPVIDRNIRSMMERRQREMAERSWEHRLADVIAAFAGSMRFVWLHVALYGAWIIINLEWTPLAPFDPTFVVLAMFASVEAIFLSTFVLINQNRMVEMADERADLNLQVSLLTEHEITRIVRLVQNIANRMGVETADDPELAELARDVAPEKMLDRIAEHARE